MKKSEEISNARGERAVYSLDWLRGLASLMVCLFHVRKYVWVHQPGYLLTRLFDQGYLGVYIFFVISGFVIPYSMYVNRYSLRRFPRYIAKRTVRIEPPYIIFILILLVWNRFLYGLKGWGTPWLYNPSQFLLNVTYLAPFFNVKWILVIFWTLGIEFQFYLLSGLIQEELQFTAKRYALFAVILGIGFLIPDHYQTVFHNYIYFIAGFQTFLFFIKKIGRTEYLVSCVLIFLFILKFSVPVAAPLVLLTSAAILWTNFRSRISRFFGKISYSLYLTHGLTGAAVTLFMLRMLGPVSLFLTAVGASILFAWIYYALVEKFFLKKSKAIRY